MKKLLFIFLFSLSGCTKFEDPIIGLGNKIELVTSKVNIVSSDSAIFEGNIIKVGNEGITERGFAYNTSSKPQVNNKSIKSGTGLGNFTGIATDLLPNTNYFISAYAYNKFGTIYGNELNFYTPKSPPRLKPTIISTFTPYSAVISSDIILDGGNEVLERGVCWNTKPKPLITNNKVVNSSGSNSFETSISNLIPSSTYYVRSYAVNSLGAGYGQEIILRTLDIKPAILENNCIEPSLIGYDEATLNINVIDNGLSLNLETGIIIGLTPKSSELTYNNSNTQTIKSSLISTGKVSLYINNLSVNTNYYYVAYAKNESGISYSPICTFKTLDYTPPKLNQTCITASNIGTNLATITSEVINDGGIKTIEKGFIFSTSNQYLTYQNPNSQTVISSETIKGKYSFVLTKLKAKTKYYYIPYAKNSKGISYGSQCDFITEDYAKPQLYSSCIDATDLTRNSVKIYGNITDDGGDSTLEKGFIYARNSDLMYIRGGANTLVSSGKGKGPYSFVINNLNSNTDYYYRSYALNETGNLVYGPLCRFTTNIYDLPTINSDCLLPSLDFTSATISGNLISWGGADSDYNYIQKGVIWASNLSEISGANPTGQIIMAGGYNTGIFNITIPNLTNGTTYYYRVFAKNRFGIAFGPTCTFTTNKYSVPSFDQTCINPTNISNYNATIYASIKSSDGITYSRGFLVSKSSSPSVLDITNVNTIGTSGEQISSNIMSLTLSSNNGFLTPATTFYYRAYLTNSVGTGYGPICSFTTLDVPKVVTGSVTNLLSTSATLNGSIVNNGGETIANGSVGFEWSYINSFQPGGYSFTSAIFNSPNFSRTRTFPSRTNIYYRAYATNSVGTGYGAVVMFRTP